MADGTQALQDLTQVFSDIASSLRRGVEDFDNLLTKIQQQNGVDPQAVETLTQTGRGLVTSFGTELDKVEAVLNPPASSSSSPENKSAPDGTVVPSGQA